MMKIKGFDFYTHILAHLGVSPSGRNSIPVFNDTPHFVIPYQYFDTSAVIV